MRRPLAFAVAMGLAVAASVTSGSLTACTSGDSSSSTSSTSGGSCPDDLATACPTTVPSYANDVAPLVQERCTPCHAPGGQASSRVLTDYPSLFASRSPVLNQVYACRMPPRGAPPLTLEGRKLLLDWLVCGAPNN